MGITTAIILSAMWFVAGFVTGLFMGMSIKRERR